jgi:serine/threonine protein kinase
VTAIVHCTRALQIENCLIFQRGMSQQIKIADFENAAVFGTTRSSAVTPYICPPEVAAAMCKGDTSQLIVSGTEDVWAVGVMVLRLLGLREPFSTVDTTAGDISGSKLSAIARLSYSDVSAVLRKAGVTPDSELESFLIGSRGSPGCLAIEPQARATVSQLLAKGWISGGHHTQLNREGADTVREMVTRIDAIEEDINDLGSMLQESLEEKIQEAQERFEKKLAEDVQQKERQIALILAAAEDDATDQEEVQMQAQKYTAELEQIRSSQAQERAEHAAKLEAMRNQFDDLQQEKLDGLMEVEESVAERAKGMMSDLAKEGGDVAERVQAMQSEEQAKLRARLEARQKKRAQSLLEEIEKI